MADLDIVYMEQCKSLSRTAGANVGGYEQWALWTPYPQCTCKAWQFSKRDKNGAKTCKHIKKAREEKCCWHQQFGISQLKKGVCPVCGGETEIIKVGV